MALSTQDLKELAQRALKDDNFEAAKFLINSALQGYSEPEPPLLKLAPDPKANLEPVQLPISNLVPAILNQQGTDLALCHYLCKHEGEEVRFSQIARYFENVYGQQLDQTWVCGEDRPKWRQLISRGISSLRDMGLLTKGKMRTSHVVCIDFTALIP
jgi:hypothetical protein